MAKGRFLRRCYPPSKRCACPCPALSLPWQRFSAGAVWECARCGQQWAYRLVESDDDPRRYRLVPTQARWVRLSPHETLPPESVSADGAPPGAWRSILTTKPGEGA